MIGTCSPSRRAHAMTRRAVALGLIGLVWSAARLGAQTGTGTITGHVADSVTGRPVVAVRLSVVGTDQAAVTAQVRGGNPTDAGRAQRLHGLAGQPCVNSAVAIRPLGAVSEGDLSSFTEHNALSAIAPEDIESVDILNDASAPAIYGGRGANGVV